MVDESVMDYSADGKDCPIPGHPCTYVARQVFFSSFSTQQSTNLFADDTSSFVTDSVPSLLESKLQERTDSLSIWFAKWHLTVNPTKSAVMVFRSRKMQAVNICITVDSHQVPQVSHHRHLGVTFSDTLGWTSHVDTIVRAASAKVGFLRRLRKRLNPLIMRQLYTYYLYSPVSRVRKYCLGWTDETRRREAWKMQPLCSSTNF